MTTLRIKCHSLERSAFLLEACWVGGPLYWTGVGAWHGHVLQIRLLGGVQDWTRGSNMITKPDDRPVVRQNGRQATSAAWVRPTRSDDVFELCIEMPAKSPGLS